MSIMGRLLLVLALLIGAVPAFGQSGDGTSKPSEGEPEKTSESDEPKAEKPKAWQYSPYRIQVWVAMDFDGRLTPSLLANIRERVIAGSEAAAFATWLVEVDAVPDAHLRADVLGGLETLTPNQFHALAGFNTIRVAEPGQPPSRRTTRGKEEEQEEEAEKWAVSPNAELLRNAINAHDKIVLIAIRAGELGYEVVGREVDVPTRHIGLPRQRVTRQRETIADHVFQILFDAFRPIVRIDKVSANGKEVDGMIRAGGLVEGPESPSAVDVNHSLVPVVRNNDRLGQPKEFNGIRATEWSYLQVTERNGEDVKMALHSALRGPLGGRGGSRVQKFALLVRPRANVTRVRLVSKTRQRPLGGYEIFSRHLTDKDDSVYIGLTNWNGEIDVEQQGDVPLRLLYIKNGGSLLAGIPLLAGHLETTEAEMRDDETRLQAEAFIRSVQNNILDTVAQRQMIRDRINKAVDEGNTDFAKKQLAQYRTLTTLPAVLDLLNRRKRDMSTPDAHMQRSIDVMFEDTQQLAVQYLDEKLEAELNRKVGGVAPAPKQ
ncbi:MAG: hypothetical protein KDB14_25565 [Planctomycetales bacterium]|nr:hypothetical protein [Planctomycetales bacterium]